jgi:hypothetical protein
MTEGRKPGDPWQQVREPRKGSSLEEPPPGKSEAGSNPYDTFPNLRSKDPAHRHSDLRRLSEWIRLKRQVEALKGGKPK